TRPLEASQADAREPSSINASTFGARSAHTSREDRMRQIRVTVSGSFSRHLDDIQRAVAELNRLGVRVLSPAQPTIVDALDGFVFVASDRHRSVRLVQDRHLASITNSDFLWLECADGYVGQSAALELGFA